MIETAILAILQGLTEFLPVSSSGHLTLAQHFLGMHDMSANLSLDIVLHAGTLVAVIWFFRQELLPYATTAGWQDAERRRIFLLVFLGSVPTALIGLGAKDFFEELFASPRLVCLSLAITGFLLLASDRFRRREAVSTLGTLPIWQALIVGVAQGMAITPGISRSGTTIAVALLLGLSGSDAARFSFLLMIPAVGGATLLEARKVLATPPESPLVLGMGFVLSLVTGLLALRLLVHMISKQRLAIFAYYLFLLSGAAFLALSLTGGAS